MDTLSVKQNRELVIKVFKGRCGLNPAHRYSSVHEIIPKSLKKDWWVIGNQIPLCSKCHDKIHREGSKNYVDRLTEVVWTKLLQQVAFQELIEKVAS